MQILCLLLDIEGTTTPIDFVYKVLFPFARRHVNTHLEQNWQDPQVKADVEILHVDYFREQSLDLPPWTDQTPASVTAYVHWLMDRDRKSTALKSLQGKIWHAGYLSGELRGEVYTDVPFAFERWRRQEKKICIFSSGSVLAQKLLFAHSTAGDLSPFIASYFDTTIGPKKEPESYRRIAQALNLPPPDVLFVSDVAAELDAACAAGMQSLWCLREKQPATAPSTHAIIHTFDEIFP